MTRWLLFAQWACLVLLLAGAANMSGLAAGDSGDGPRPVPTPGPTGGIQTGTSPAASPCPAVQKAVGYYRRKYTATRQRMNLEGAPARHWYPCAAAKRRAVEWRNRSHAARRALATWTTYHYDWRKWLPRNWYLVGRCETGYGGDPNWEFSNSKFTSAFGISWREYNADAAYMGAPPWHVRHTPRDQYKAALGHYARFGDGWSCPGP